MAVAPLLRYCFWGIGCL